MSRLWGDKRAKLHEVLARAEDGLDDPPSIESPPRVDLNALALEVENARHYERKCVADLEKARERRAAAEAAFVKAANDYIGLKVGP